MSFLTDDQFESLKEFIGLSIDEAIEKRHFITKDDISHLPTKDEFYTETAKIYSEVQATKFGCIIFVI